MARLLLTDDEWELIADVFPEPAATGRPRRDARTVLDGILWVLRGALHGATCPRSLVRGKRLGGCSIRGTRMERWPKFCIACKRHSLRPARSTTSCGVSTARRCGRRDVPAAVEKKGPQGARRPRVRPFSRGFYDENPHPLRWPWSPLALPPHGWPNARIVRDRRAARSGR